jgi:hypothetical protein
MVQTAKHTAIQARDLCPLFFSYEFSPGDVQRECIMQEHAGIAERLRSEGEAGY